MSDLEGFAVKDPNYTFRFTLILFLAISVAGSIVFWKSRYLFAEEYQDLPVTQAQLKIKKQNEAKQKALQDLLTTTPK